MLTPVIYGWGVEWGLGTIIHPRKGPITNFVSYGHAGSAYGMKSGNIFEPIENIAIFWELNGIGNMQPGKYSSIYSLGEERIF